MGKIEVGVVALHRRTGCAGVVERVFAPGEYRGADGRLVNRAVVQLSSGDALLLDSAELLDRKMREIRDGGRVVGLERIAVMAALNIANELLHSRERGEVLETKSKARVRAMRERVEGALQSGRQLEL